MATRIKFRQAKEWVKRNPALALSGTGVAISGTNLAVNASRRTESRDYQKKQLDAMDRLTNSINGLDQKLEKNETTPARKPNIIFKLKK